MLDGCQLIDLPVIADSRGTLTVVEGNTHIPFQIARVFYMYDVAAGSERGGHALKTTHQVLIATSGSVTVHLDDGEVQDECHLDSPSQGLHIPPGIWRSMDGFSANSVLLVMASTAFDADDYFHDWDDFLAHHQDYR